MQTSSHQNFSALIMIFWKRILIQLEKVSKDNKEKTWCVYQLALSNEK